MKSAYNLKWSFYSNLLRWKYKLIGANPVLYLCTIPRKFFFNVDESLVLKKSERFPNLSG